MHAIEIHPYSSAYKQAVSTLILSIQQGEFNIPVTLEMQPDLNDIPGFYQVNRGNFWLATNNTKVVGTIALLDIGHSQGALRKMFVHELFRGKNYGVGQLLLNTLLNWAKQHQFTELFLGTTAKFKAAQRFYEKNGFREIDKTLLPETFPIMAVDVKFYTCTLLRETEC